MVAAEREKGSSKIDSIGDGRISASNLQSRLPQIMHLDRGGEPIMDEIEKDSDGHTDFNEFAGDGNDDLKVVFDKDKNKLISASELQAVLGSMGQNKVETCHLQVRSGASRSDLVHYKGSSFTYSPGTISICHFSNRFNSLSSCPLNEKTSERSNKPLLLGSDSEGELDDLSREDLVKLANESKTLLETKQKEITATQDKVLHSYAKMENVMDRARREVENSKKFAIQIFTKGLLDVADNFCQD